ncbi:MAG: threonylcarbamoyl-AMP synthase [Candidatus Eisenbacteria bacterium]|nr:threonylcarbamoyl-AMP synthase [Candidatus Eisenbacteria bacterium]
MEILKIDAAAPQPEALEAAAEAVLRGGVIAFPTDTLYGLSCSLLDASAVEMLARLKRRDPSHAVISLIPSPDMAWALAYEVPPAAERLIRAFWPGPLSIILPASGFVPERVRGSGATVALRCPNDRLSLALLARIGGPIVSSSANLSGRPPATTAEEVVSYFGNQLDLVLDGGPRLGGLPSTLVDCSGARPKLLRRGAVDISSVLTDFEDLSSPPGDG